MTAHDVLKRQLLNQQTAFLAMVKRVPSDKMDWVPQEGMRSALDQFQEVATAISSNWSIYEHRKAEGSMKSFHEWLSSRAKLVVFEELEARLRADTDMLLAHLESLPVDELRAPVQLPWGEHIVADTVTFHLWNMAYHEGQIAYMLQMLGIDPMG